MPPGKTGSTDEDVSTTPKRDATTGLHMGWRSRTREKRFFNPIVNVMIPVLLLFLLMNNHLSPARGNMSIGRGIRSPLKSGFGCGDLFVQRNIHEEYT